MGELKPLAEPALAESIVSKRGRTTTNGAVDGSTVVDTDLTEVNDYWNDMTLLILSGACDGQSRDITDFAGGTLTVSPVFASRILSGVRYLILPIKPSFAEIADLDIDISKVVQQVALTGHPASSIGKILYDFYITRLTSARCGYLANINNANLATIADISSLTATEIAHLDADISSRAPANEYDTEMGMINADVATEAKQDVIEGFHDVPGEDSATDAQMRDVVGKKTDTVAGTSIVAIAKQVKAKTDNLSAANTDEQGSPVWVTLTHTTAEFDISSLFTTPLTGTTRRKYSLFLDLTGPAGDTAAWTECTVKVKVEVDGTNPRTVDKKVLAKTDVAAGEEPGVNIDIPAVAKDVQVTMQFDVALDGDQTIYYSVVTEVLE